MKCHSKDLLIKRQDIRQKFKLLMLEMELGSQSPNITE